jgi:hypothetical protein
MAALRLKPKSIVKTDKSCQKRLVFADSISYSACLGYQDSKKAEVVADTVSYPKIMSAPVGEPRSATSQE